MKVSNTRTTAAPNPGGLLKFLDAPTGFTSSYAFRAVSAPNDAGKADLARYSCYSCHGLVLKKVTSEQKESAKIAHVHVVCWRM